MTLFGQVNLDPNNPIYTSIEEWEDKGYLSNLPPFKPYPLPYLKTLLNSVIERGNRVDIAKAENYLEECTNKFSGTFSLSGTISTIDKDFLAEAMFTTRGMVSENISIGLKGGSYFTLDEKNMAALPQFQRLNADYNTDTSNIGPLELMSSWNSVATYSGDSWWISSGIGKSSFGEFNNENIYFNPNAPQTAYFSLTYLFDKIIFTKSFHQLVATDLKGEGEYPEKFLSMDGLKWQITSWLNLGIYDTIVFGNRFDILYLVPLTQHMYGQGVNGFIDNALIGVTGELNFPQNINLKGQALVDDFAFNDAMKLNFDSKFKFAFETKLNWAPHIEKINKLELGYTLITPHMYSHEPAKYTNENGTIVYDYTDDSSQNINYVNYTNRGESIGSTLLPNSDKISFTGSFNMPFGVDLTVFADFIRNANSNDSLPESYGGYNIVKQSDGSYFIDLDGEDRERTNVTKNIDGTWSKADENEDEAVIMEPLYLGDGSINDHGLVIVDKYGNIQNHWEYVWLESFPFLKQANILYTFQTGLNISKKLSPEIQILNGPYKKRDMTLNLNYTYQNNNGDSDHFFYLSISAEL